MRSFRATPVDTFQQHRELCWAQTHGARIDTGPHEVAMLKPLGEQAHAVATPPQDLNTIASPPSKDKDMAAKGICTQCILHNGRQTIKS